MDQMHQNYCLTNLANVVLKLLLKMMSMSALTSRVTKMDNVVLKSVPPNIEHECSHEPSDEDGQRSADVGPENDQHRHNRLYEGASHA
jgi:hypothetical protein